MRAHPRALGLIRPGPVRVGDEFTTPLQIFWGDRWRDLGIIFAYTVFKCMGLLLDTLTSAQRHGHSARHAVRSSRQRALADSAQLRQLLVRLPSSGASADLCSRR